MRVALQIDGDASGAVKAASDTSGAVTDLGKLSEATSHAIEEGFKNAVDAIDKLKNSSQAVNQAAQDAARAMADIGKPIDPNAEGLKVWADALENLKKKSQGAGAANDNAAESALGLAGK